MTWEEKEAEMAKMIQNSKSKWNVINEMGIVVGRVVRVHYDGSILYAAVPGTPYPFPFGFVTSTMRLEAM